MWARAYLEDVLARGEYLDRLQQEVHGLVLRREQLGDVPRLREKLIELCERARVEVEPLVKVDEAHVVPIALVCPLVVDSLLVAVAFVVPARVRPVLRPRTFAQPAELVPAVLARHVHAALVLLDGDLALGALLRVLRDPERVYLVPARLLVPFCLFVAACGQVRLCTAVEALSEVALADNFEAPVGDGGDADGARTLCGIAAPYHLPVKRTATAKQSHVRS